MKTVRAPEKKLIDFYDLLVDSIREDTIVPSGKGNQLGMKARSSFKEAKEVLVDAEELYLEKLQQGIASEIPIGQYRSHNNSADELTNEDYKWLYRKFRNSKSTASLVNSLLNISDKTCIYCESRHGNNELDHFLPESEYDYLTIVPSNLLPSCTKCNRKKSSNVSDIYHPYFSDFSKQRFITCEIIIEPGNGSYIELGNCHSNNSIYFEYKLVDRDKISDTVLYDKVKNVFETLELSKKYSEMMIDIFDEEINELTKMLNILGIDSFLEILCIKKDSRLRRYSWNSCIIPFYLSLINLLQKSSYFAEIFKLL